MGTLTLTAGVSPHRRHAVQSQPLPRARVQPVVTVSVWLKLKCIFVRAYVSLICYRYQQKPCQYLNFYVPHTMMLYGIFSLSTCYWMYIIYSKFFYGKRK